MKVIKTLLILALFPILLATSAHKYYVSVTKIEYIQNEKSLQIISRVFIDDFELLLKQRYDKNVVLDPKLESSNANDYIKRYLKQKLGININNKPTQINYLGKEYENDIIYFYIEINNVEAIKTLNITNKLLFDQFEEQQNIVRTNIYAKHKTFILTPSSAIATLNF